MLNGFSVEDARDALLSIPPDLPRDEWVKAGMAAQAAGLDFDAFNDWSAGAGNYSEPDARSTWRSFKPGKGVGAGTLFKLAAENGWRMGADKPCPKPAARKAAEPPRKLAHGLSAAEVWERCEQATNAHPYIVAKQAAGVPLDGLRVLPAGDALRIAGEPMAGALVLPVHRANGSLSVKSRLFIDSFDEQIRFLLPPGLERLNWSLMMQGALRDAVVVG